MTTQKKIPSVAMFLKSRYGLHKVHNGFALTVKWKVTCRGPVRKRSDVTDVRRQFSIQRSTHDTTICRLANQLSEKIMHQILCVD